MKIASRTTPEGLAGYMCPASHGLSTTALNPPLFTVLGLVIAQTIMHMFQLGDVLRFDSTVVIHVLITISSPKLNNQIF